MSGTEGDLGIEAAGPGGQRSTRTKTRRRLTVPFPTVDLGALFYALLHVVHTDGGAGIDGISVHTLGGSKTKLWTTARRLEMRLKRGVLAPRRAVGPAKHPVVAVYDRVVARYLNRTAFAGSWARLPAEVVGHRLRPDRSAPDAFPRSAPQVVEDILDWIQLYTQLWLIKVDIAACFQSIDPLPVVAQLEREGFPPHATSWIRDFYAAQHQPGLIAGLPLAPLLSHVHLEPLDTWALSVAPGRCYRRFGDDLFLLATSERHAMSLKADLDAQVAALGLGLNFDKSYIGPVSGEFEALGYQFRSLEAHIPERAVAVILDRLASADDGAKQRQIYAGWVGQYRLATDEDLLEVHARVTGLYPHLAKISPIDGTRSRAPARLSIFPPGQEPELAGSLTATPEDGFSPMVDDVAPGRQGPIHDSSKSGAVSMVLGPCAGAAGEIIVLPLSRAVKDPDWVLREPLPHIRMRPGQFERVVFGSTAVFLDWARAFEFWAVGPGWLEWACRARLRDTPARVVRLIRIAHVIVSALETRGKHPVAYIKDLGDEAWEDPQTDDFPITVIKAMFRLHSDQDWAWHLRGTVAALVVQGRVSSTQAVSALEHAKRRARRVADEKYLDPYGGDRSIKWTVKLKDGTEYRYGTGEIEVDLSATYSLIA